MYVGKELVTVKKMDIFIQVPNHWLSIMDMHGMVQHLLFASRQLSFRIALKIVDKSIILIILKNTITIISKK